jgi:uncharacterized protein YceH (UPF0502 family)
MKYKHNLAIVYPLLPTELAVICLLLLRGPLTPGEINTNSARLYEFETIEEVQQILHKLAVEEPVIVRQLDKKPGQKEARYKHLFGGTAAEPDDQEEENGFEIQPLAVSNLEERVAKLEKELEELKEMLHLLMS